MAEEKQEITDEIIDRWGEILKHAHEGKNVAADILSVERTLAFYEQNAADVEDIQLDLRVAKHMHSWFQDRLTETQRNRAAYIEGIQEHKRRYGEIEWDSARSNIRWLFLAHGATAVACVHVLPEDAISYIRVPVLVVLTIAAIGLIITVIGTAIFSEAIGAIHRIWYGVAVPWATNRRIGAARKLEQRVNRKIGMYSVWLLYASAVVFSVNMLTGSIWLWIVSS